MHPPTIVWFRQDLRLADNPALAAAAAEGAPVLCCFVHEDPLSTARPRGTASRWWLSQSLERLGRDLRRVGATLHVLRGRPDDTLVALAGETGARSVHWNRCYEPTAVARDTRLKSRFKEFGIRASSHNASLLVEPWDLTTATGTPYKVFSAFWRALSARIDPPRPVPPPRALIDADGASRDKKTLDAASPTTSDANRLRDLETIWNPGEEGAQDRLAAFLDADLEGYKNNRDRPDLAATSRLSAHLHFGEISPRQIWHAVRQTAPGTPDADKFLSEIAWREFSHYLLFHFPDMATSNWQSRFDRFPWQSNAAGLRAWQEGETGYPIVDAGMRELKAAGSMHNRVRMIAASFLTKHLLIDWRHGEAWFWDHLVDADLASNTANWQWVAGCGADAAPYFRIFNPVLQGQRFDPEGTYVKRWVPELEGLDANLVHEPWAAAPDDLRRAGIRLGHSYPEPVIDHAMARKRALSAFEHIRE